MSQTPQMTPQQTARLVSDYMVERDTASRMLGMEVVEIAPGRAVMRMTVREDMLNAHRTCHGGCIAALADSAFAWACNSYNELTVAAGFSLDILLPGRPGEVLTATASERAKGGRTGLYDVEVRNPEGGLVATFRGRSYTMKGKPAVPGTQVG